MSDFINKVTVTAVNNQEQARQLLEKLLAVAQPGAVFSQPVTSGEYTVITAAEVTAGMGFGFGFGGGSSPAAGGQPKEAAPLDEAEGMGGGGGGGGTVMARPVAVLTIGPRGVSVEPTVDATKIALAFFTTLGAMFMMAGRMRRKSKP
ncbi:MAG: spore germination protein GerW family protein [Chloroflexota bacterium]